MAVNRNNFAAFSYCSILSYLCDTDKYLLKPVLSAGPVVLVELPQPDVISCIVWPCILNEYFSSKPEKLNSHIELSCILICEP